MRLDGCWPMWAWGPWARWAAGAWLAVLMAVCGHALLRPRSHSLYPTYAAAGRDWLAGRTPYRDHWEPYEDQFRYSPLVAALLVPFHLLPEGPGGALWRLANAGFFLGALGWWLRAAAPRSVSARERALLFLLVLPLSLGSLHNGQANPLVAGLLLAALAGAAAGRWAPAAGCVALAASLKVYPLVLGLLLATLYPRRFAPRLALALGVALALPFLLQSPGYVAEQYGLWYRRLRPADEFRRFWPAAMAYRDLWLLFRVAGVPITLRGYLGVQLLAGAGCAGVCLAGRLRGWPRQRVLEAALTLGTCWMMLCGPATESCTYVLLAPALAWGLLSAAHEPWPLPARLLAWSSAGLLLACVLACLFPGTARVHGLGLHPLAALLFTGGYLAATLRGPDAPARTARPPGRAAAESATGGPGERGPRPRAAGPRQAHEGPGASCRRARAGAGSGEA